MTVKLSKQIPSLKERSSILKFLDEIESTWKGHERFAVWLVKQISPKVVVDLGFDRGLSLLSFATQRRAKVYGVDWFQEQGYAEKSLALEGAMSAISEAIRLGFGKNIELIIGPFDQVAARWKKKIDLLHIDWAHSYEEVKSRFVSWGPHLCKKGVLLIHDVASSPDGVGRFYQELSWPKILLPHAGGLGVASEDPLIIDKIADLWEVTSVF